jgi:hypothetical protein
MALLTSEVTRQIDPFPRLEIQVPDVAGFSRAEPRIICRREAIAANSETEEETWGAWSGAVARPRLLPDFFPDRRPDLSLDGGGLAGGMDHRRSMLTEVDRMLVLRGGRIEQLSAGEAPG